MHFHNRAQSAIGILKVGYSLLPVFIFVLIIYAFDAPLFATLTLICAALHELGHIICIKCLGYKSSIRGVLSGPKIYIGTTVGYRHTVLIALSGPLMNISLALISLPFSAFFGDIATYFSLINVISAVCNLIPMVNNDGYNVLLSLINLRLDEYLAERIMTAVSLVFSSALCIFSLYAMSRLNAAYWCYFLSMYLLVKGTRMS